MPWRGQQLQCSQSAGDGSDTCLPGNVCTGPRGFFTVAPLSAVPHFSFFITSLDSGVPWTGIGLIAPVALVTMSEHLGEQIVVSRVTGCNFLRDPGLHRTSTGDGLATSIGAFLGGRPNTTYGENIGVLAITTIFSIYVIAGAAVFGIVLAFVGKLAAFIATIPMPVFGGVAIALFGAIVALVILVLGIRLWPIFEIAIMPVLERLASNAGLV